MPHTAARVEEREKWSHILFWKSPYVNFATTNIMKENSQSAKREMRYFVDGVDKGKVS
jgi:hypothetical protein